MPIFRTLSSALAVPASARAPSAPTASVTTLILVICILSLSRRPVKRCRGGPGGRRRDRPQYPKCLLRFLDRGLDHLRIGAEPLGFLDELAALRLEDLDPAAALMVLAGDLQRRHQPAQREVVNRLETLLDL